jgi:hypothetical protein
MKLYRGCRDKQGAVVVEVIEDIKNGTAVHDVASLKVKSLHHVVKHSPTGFEFGYGGSGPSDLARCILIDMGYPVPQVDMVYQEFKTRFIENADYDGFIIDEDAIRFWWETRKGELQ